jgi:hypothetical protein
MSGHTVPINVGVDVNAVRAIHTGLNPYGSLGQSGVIFGDSSGGAQGSFLGANQTYYTATSIGKWVASYGYTPIWP